MPFRKLQNKVAIVTGGSQGIGEAISYAYAKEGAIVIVANNSKPQLGTKVADAIIKAGGKAEAIRCNVMISDEVNALVKHVVDKYGRADILVNNAGVVGPRKPMDELTLENYQQVMDVNLKGPFMLSKAVIPIMKKQRYGKIINISSAAACVGLENLAIYSASKAALNGMTRAMVAELARYGINVNTISPGNVQTPINEENWSNPEVVKILTSLIPSKVAFMDPKEIADAALYLASDEAKSIHGLDLIIDNGFSAAR